MLGQSPQLGHVLQVLIESSKVIWNVDELVADTDTKSSFNHVRDYVAGKEVFISTKLEKDCDSL